MERTTLDLPRAVQIQANISIILVSIVFTFAIYIQKSTII